MMKVEEAIEIVLNLARQNQTTEKDKTAISTIEDFFTNVVFADDETADEYEDQMARLVAGSHV